MMSNSINIGRLKITCTVQEVPLEACNIGLNWPISILFAVSMSEGKVASIKPNK